MNIFNIDINLAIVVLAMILADIITGLAKAIATDTFKSTEMRKGLWHKAGSVGLLFLAAGITVACQVVDVLPEEFAIVYVPACLYIFVMELSSILENILALNPQLDRFKIFQIFGQTQDDDIAGDETDDEEEQEEDVWATIEAVLERNSAEKQGDTFSTPYDTVSIDYGVPYIEEK